MTLTQFIERYNGVGNVGTTTENTGLIWYNIFMKNIPLTQGKQTLVDDEDFDFLNQYKWFYHKQGYAVRQSGSIRMHRLLMNTPKRQEVDHINGNRLDNQRKNLRNVTHQQNQMNKHSALGASNIKGVYWHKQAQKWYSRIKINYKDKYLGLFDTKEKAENAYKKAARKIFGEFYYESD